MIEEFARRARNVLRGLRIGSSGLHKVMAWEYRLRQAGFLELSRLLYYQPLFESLCASVGEGVHLELVPTSKLPAINHVRLELGDRVRISAQTTFNGARRAPGVPRIRIGADSYVGYGALLGAGLEMVIGRHVLIAAHSFVCGDPGHPLDAEARKSEPAPVESLSRIVIEDSAWLALGATVLGEVRIGEGAIVAARAVVTRDVPPYTVVAGNPARAVRSLTGRETECDRRRLHHDLLRGK